MTSEWHHIWHQSLDISRANLSNWHLTFTCACHIAFPLDQVFLQLAAFRCECVALVCAWWSPACKSHNMKSLNLCVWLIMTYDIWRLNLTSESEHLTSEHLTSEHLSDPKNLEWRVGIVWVGCCFNRILARFSSAAYLLQLRVHQDSLCWMCAFQLVELLVPGFSCVVFLLLHWPNACLEVTTTSEQT
jgi:hypothetical protein